jgi:hypothetical protein
MVDKKLTARPGLNVVPNFMDTNCGVSVNLSHLPNSTTPLHIVLWKGVDTPNPTVTCEEKSLNLETNATIKLLLDRITVLESMVNGLLETQKSSLWFSQGLRPTPSGIEIVSRRESMGAESDIGTVLSQLVRPSDASDIRTVTIAPTTEGLSLGGPRVNIHDIEETESYEQNGGDEVEEDQEQVEEEEQVEQEEEQKEQVEEEQQEQVEEEQQVEEDQQVEEEQVEEEQVEEEQEQEEEQVEEYKQVEWKGQSYWVDGSQQVYEMDSDGDLIDTPIGIWREETQKLVRYKVAV